MGSHQRIVAGTGNMLKTWADPLIIFKVKDAHIHSMNVCIDVMKPHNIQLAHHKQLAIVYHPCSHENCDVQDLY